MPAVPPRLSDEQKFILIHLYHNNADGTEIEKDISSIYEQKKETISRSIEKKDVSTAVAREFDNFETVEQETEVDEEEYIEMKESEVDWWDYVKPGGLEDEKITYVNLVPAKTDSHQTTFYRSLDRLKERGLMEDKNRNVWIGTDERIHLTDEGYEAAEELAKRESDGRYNLSFDKEW